MAEAIQKVTDKGWDLNNICSQNIELKINQIAKDINDTIDLKLKNFDNSYEFSKKSEIFNQDIEHCETVPPEIVKIMVQKLDHHCTSSCKMKSLSFQKPWSHDVYSLGVFIIEILTGFPLNVANKCLCKNLNNQTKVSRGYFGIELTNTDNLTDSEKAA